MGRLPVILNTELNTFLEEEAGKVAKIFSIKYRNWRNPGGKESILVYGDCPNVRSEFADKIFQKLPSGINAFVLDEDKKIKLGERNENPQTFYVDFNTLLKRTLNNLIFPVVLS